MSTCKGAPAPHSCTHGDACDWDGYTHRGDGKPYPPGVHPDNTDEAQAAHQKEMAEREQRFRDSIRHLPLRRQRKMLAKYGLEGPQGGDHTPQAALSRRTRRAMARATQKARKGAEIATYAQAHVDVDEHNEAMESFQADTPLDKGYVKAESQALPDGWRVWPLKDLRHLAQEKGVRVDGKRPSLCSKAELLGALEAL